MAAAGPARARALLQQSLSARLQIQRGLVIYICFFKGADEDLIPKIALDHLEECVMPRIPDKSIPFLWLADISDLAKGCVTIVYFRVMGGPSSAQIRVLLKMLRGDAVGFSPDLGGHSLSETLNKVEIFGCI